MAIVRNNFVFIRVLQKADPYMGLDVKKINEAKQV